MRLRPAKVIDSCNSGSDSRYLADSLFAKRPSIYRARASPAASLKCRFDLWPVDSLAEELIDVVVWARLC
jgi:hypothetical protein